MRAAARGFAAGMLLQAGQRCTPAKGGAVAQEWDTKMSATCHVSALGPSSSRSLRAGPWGRARVIQSLRGIVRLYRLQHCAAPLPVACRPGRAARAAAPRGAPRALRSEFLRSCSTRGAATLATRGVAERVVVSGLVSRVTPQAWRPRRVGC